MNIMDASRYFVYLSYNKDKNSLTPLKLQKLLYLAQGWNYVWDGYSLFEDEFEAWQYGPVNVGIYDYFKKYGKKEIPREEGDECLSVSYEEKETLEAIWTNYGSCGTFELVNLTHSHKPWINAFNAKRKIKNSEIEYYFKTVY